MVIDTNIFIEYLRKLEFRDVMIAATAIYHNLPIKTLNFKHFERIPDLKIIY